MTKILPCHVAALKKGFGAASLPCIFFAAASQLFYREAAAGIRYCQRKPGWHHQSDIVSAAQLLNVAWRNVQGDLIKWERTFSHLSTNKNNVENMNNVADRRHIVIYINWQHTKYNNNSLIAGCCFEAVPQPWCSHTPDGAVHTGTYSNCDFEFPIIYHLATMKSQGYI